MDSKIIKLYEKININNNTFIIFGLSYCNYSKKTIDLLQSKNLSYKYYKIDKYYSVFLKFLEKLNIMHPSLNINTNHKTFPIIFYKKKFIGGFSDLYDLKLDK
jgi:glutaredoxin